MRRCWSAEKIAKLKGLAGKRSAAEIAADLGRPKSATVVKAHTLGVSLRVKNSMDPGPSGMDLQAEGAVVGFEPFFSLWEDGCPAIISRKSCDRRPNKALG